MKMTTTAMRTCFVVLLLAATVAGKDTCHSEDKKALVAINAALGIDNPYQHYQTPDDTCCYWFGYYVDCDPITDRVVGLSITQDANLTGTIPDAIAGLVHLNDLELHHLPGIYGPIPPAIAKLSNLSSLTISYTGVSGPVPSFLGNLPALTYLKLAFNSLTGAIPASLAALSLSYLDLSRNRLTGSIPPLLLSRSPDQDIYLDLSHNNLSGGIPAEFAAVGFWHLDLSRNALTGGLFRGGKELQFLDLSRNAFSFNLSTVELPEQLVALDLSHNAIYGGIPAQVANLTNLRLFNVSYNHLCGGVPTGGNMATFDAYNYQHNKCLCGSPLPTCNN